MSDLQWAEPLRRAGGGGADTDGSTLLAGVLSCVFGNIGISLALNLQRMAHRNNKDDVHYTRLKGWWMGLVCMFVGEIGNFMVIVLSSDLNFAF
jgi:hypothetical protein